MFFVIVLVLVVVLLYVFWNVLFKSSYDCLVLFLFMILGVGLGVILLVLWWLWLQVESWFYILFLGLLYIGYNLFLICVYCIGDFGQFYLIVCGFLFLLVVLGVVVFVGEQLGIYMVIGIVLVLLGIVSLVNLCVMCQCEYLFGLLVVLVIGVFIVVYIIIDGIGVWLVGDVIVYVGWLFVVDSILLVLLYQYKYGCLLVVFLYKDIWIGLMGGVMLLLVYGIVIWVVMFVFMGMVLVLCEILVLFVFLIGMLFLGEKLMLWWVLFCVVIVVGVIVFGVYY